MLNKVKIHLLLTNTVLMLYDIQAIHLAIDTFSYKCNVSRCRAQFTSFIACKLITQYWAGKAEHRTENIGMTDGTIKALLKGVT